MDFAESSVGGFLAVGTPLTTSRETMHGSCSTFKDGFWIIWVQAPPLVGGKI
ncbi:hypothetical protein [Nostoc sp. CMAA1605]|uniref:hypothetical protein n=1 Tax=Nostoc sp. CMAA1605 TaxID=2055159 RepID=UPI001F3E1F92|nr:hypothetical protein [Nostoc sp. CMAA1605]